MKKQIIETLTNAFKPDVRVYKEAVYLVKKGYSVTILCWDREPEDILPAHEIIDGIRVVRFRHICPAGKKRGKVKTYIQFIKSCKRYIRKSKCDYLHCNDISGAIVGVLSKKRTTPMIVDMHEFFERGSRIKRTAMHYLLVHIFKQSKAGLYENAAYLADSYKSVRDKLYPLRNYPDSNMVELRKKTKSQNLRVGFHGWLRPNMYAIKALFDAASKIDGVQVNINGGGPGLKQITEWAKGKENIFVHGPFDGTKMMSSLYENTDITFCGYDKNDPNYQGDAEVVKYYESIRTGTPMIMTAGIGMGDKVEKFGFGLTCDTFDSDEVKAALLKFKDNKNFWLECSNNEINESEKYCWESAVQILDRIYTD